MDQGEYIIGRTIRKVKNYNITRKATLIIFRINSSIEIYSSNFSFLR